MYYLRRAIGFIITLFLVTIITFAVFQILPGDPALVILGVDADPVQLENLTQALHLDQPLSERYLTWMEGLFKGDLGISFRYRQPVSSIIDSAFTVTLTLGILSLILTVLIGLPIGIWLANHDDSPVSTFISALTQLGLSIPSFCIGILLIAVFTVQLGWFPSMGYVPWSMGPLSCLRSIFLPALSIAIGGAAILIRYMRSSIMTQRKQDYVRTARSKGLSNRYIMNHHILRNSLIPVITILGMLTAEILGGSIIIENVFSLPGIGKLVATSITSRDFPLIQALVLYLALIVVSCNFLVDICYSLIDPRIRTRQ